MMIWPWMRFKVFESVHMCVRAWRRCARKRVTTTTKIVCRDHSVDGGTEEMAMVER